MRPPVPVGTSIELECAGDRRAYRA